MKENKYMSKEYTGCLRGIFALCVVIHHLYQYTGLLSGTPVGTVLQLSGYFSVAMFFFLSGYGLVASAGKENYINNFFRRRFLPLYCFYILLILLSSLWTWLLKGQVPLRLLVQSFFFGGTVVVNGWYLQTTFLAYLLFFFSFKVFQDQKFQILSFGILIFLYCSLCCLLEVAVFWYQTVPCMVFGMVYCRHKSRMDRLLKAFGWVVLAVSLVAFAASVLLTKYTTVDTISGILYSLFFVCVMVSLSYILANTSVLCNRFFALCGKYSLEIYVSHGFLLGLHQLKWMENKALYIAAVLAGTVLLSVLMKILYRKMTALFVKKTGS